MSPKTLRFRVLAYKKFQYNFSSKVITALELNNSETVLVSV